MPSAATRGRDAYYQTRLSTFAKSRLLRESSVRKGSATSSSVKQIVHVLLGPTVPKRAGKKASKNAGKNAGKKAGEKSGKAPASVPADANQSAYLAMTQAGKLKQGDWALFAQGRFVESATRKEQLLPKINQDCFLVRVGWEHPVAQLRTLSAAPVSSSTDSTANWTAYEKEKERLPIGHWALFIQGQLVSTNVRKVELLPLITEDCLLIQVGEERPTTFVGALTAKVHTEGTAGFVVRAAAHLVGTGKRNVPVTFKIDTGSDSTILTPASSAGVEFISTAANAPDYRWQLKGVTGHQEPAVPLLCKVIIDGKSVPCHPTFVWQTNEPLLGTNVLQYFHLEARVDEPSHEWTTFRLVAPTIDST